MPILPSATSEEGRLSTVAGKQRGGRPVAKRLCIIHAACKLASCSPLERNCSESETRFRFPHGQAAAAARGLRVSSGMVPHKTPLRFVCQSSIFLQRLCFNASVLGPRPVRGLRLNHTPCDTVRSIPPVHSSISNTCAVVFCFCFVFWRVFFFPPSIVPL